MKFQIVIIGIISFAVTAIVAGPLLIVMWRNALNGCTG